MRYRWDPVYPASGRWAGTRTDTHLRASDAERNEVADRLSRHYADGRLDQAEFKARLDRAIGATTRGDLDGLFDDLPRLETEPLPPTRRRRRLIPFVAIIALVAVAGGVTYPMVHVPWLLFALIGVLVWHRVGRHHRRPFRALRSRPIASGGRPLPWRGPPAVHGRTRALRPARSTRRRSARARQRHPPIISLITSRSWMHGPGRTARTG